MLRLHRSARADRLVAALGDLLATPLADPVQSEVICVPTRGVERWITQRLSHRLGICANVAFPFPGGLAGRVVAAATGIDPDGDPWAPARAVWPLVDIVDSSASDELLAPLLAHLDALAPPGEARRRFAFLRHVADLFDRYGVHRPDMICEWAASAAVAGEADGWQQHLWRLLRARLGSPSPAERLVDAVGAVTAGAVDLDLPDRISVFGLTRLPAVHLRVLSAIAATRDVHLFLLHPSDPLWSRLPSPASGADIGPRRSDQTRLVPQNPLVRSWGHDSREMQLVLAAHGVGGGEHYPVPPANDSLLHVLQSDIRADTPPSVPPAVLDANDESVRVYACHGRIRQVEVLRDALLHRLAADATLEPRDVIVMCPDIEAFAPLIQATFGSPGGGLPELRVRLADRSLRQTNPLLGVAGRLLELAGSRVTASEVIDLATRPAVARRFGFDQEELAQIERWVADTAVHWGFDADHRARWDLAGVPEGTWQAGIDRLLVGVAMSSDAGLVLGTVPYSDLPSSSVDLAGRFAELVSRLRIAVVGLQGPLRPDEWTRTLLESVEGLAEADRAEGWQLEQLRDVLSTVADEAGFGGGTATLSLDEVRSLLAGRLSGRPTSANFRTGDLTFCTLVPMRSVPHRVVALLALDEGSFPRHPETDGDDLLLRDPLVGEREARSEDRQLLLDALLAATDHLIVTYSGRDHRTNRRLPPCAPVAELLDVIDRTAVTAEGAPATGAVLIEPPLQAHDPANFAPGRPWGFDGVALRGAIASRRRRPPGAWLAEPLPARPVTAVTVDELVRFARHPVKEFLRQRLEIHLFERDNDVVDEVPLVLDGLAQWGIGDRLLEAAMRGVPVREAAQAEVGRGFLPPEAIRRSPLDDVVAKVEATMARVVTLGFDPGPAAACQVKVDLGDGLLLTGSVPEVKGDTVGQILYSRLAPKHRLAAWVRFLALTADRPDLEVRAVSLGRAPRGDTGAMAWLDPFAGTPDERRAWAVGHLRTLVGLFESGLAEPLPLFAVTSSVWAHGRRDGMAMDGLVAAVTDQWQADRFSPEGREPEMLTVWPAGRTIESLLAEPLPDAERALGAPPEETSRFGGLARILWDPLLAHERLEYK